MTLFSVCYLQELSSCFFDLPFAGARALADNLAAYIAHETCQPRFGRNASDDIVGNVIGDTYNGGSLD